MSYLVLYLQVIVKMKIQCDVCEKAEAEVLCCADEAVLCRRCDHKVHTANKLAQKHQRVFLLNRDTITSSSSSSSQLPLCDICRERNGYLFCLEDRKLLCRQCDASIHKNNPSLHLLSHQRFLIATTLQVPQNQNQSCFADEDDKPETMELELEATISTSLQTQQPVWPLDDIFADHPFDYYHLSD